MDTEKSDARRETRISALNETRYATLRFRDRRDCSLRSSGVATAHDQCALNRRNRDVGRPSLHIERQRRGSGWIVGNPYFGITSGLPVIQEQSSHSTIRLLIVYIYFDWRMGLDSKRFERECLAQRTLLTS